MCSVYTSVRASLSLREHKRKLARQLEVTNSPLALSLSQVTDQSRARGLLKGLLSGSRRHRTAAVWCYWHCLAVSNRERTSARARRRRAGRPIVIRRRGPPAQGPPSAALIAVCHRLGRLSGRQVYRDRQGRPSLSGRRRFGVE